MCKAIRVDGWRVPGCACTRGCARGLCKWMVGFAQACALHVATCKAGWACECAMGRRFTLVQEHGRVNGVLCTWLCGFAHVAVALGHGFVHMRVQRRATWECTGVFCTWVCSCARICTHVSVQNIAQWGCTHLLMGVAKAQFAHECAREVAHRCMSNV